MKLWLPLISAAALFLTACGGDEVPPRDARHVGARYPDETGAAENQPTQQPFNPNAPNTETSTEEASQAPAPPPSAPSTQKVVKGDYPYGIPVPGKQGLVKSPYAPDQGLVDTRGFSRGQEVKCPYTGKVFLVP